MPTFKYLLRVTHVDNELDVFINGTSVYHKYYDNDPLLNDVVDVTPYVYINADNSFGYVGLNGPPTNYNPSHFEFKLVEQRIIAGDDGGDIITENVIYDVVFRSEGEWPPNSVSLDLPGGANVHFPGGGIHDRSAARTKG